MEPKERKNAGNRGIGRKKGVPNKNTAALKDAILRAAELVGADGNGKEGLTGYLQQVAIADMKAFCGLLGKVLPLQVVGDMTVRAANRMTDAELEAIAAGSSHGADQEAEGPGLLN